MTVLTIGVPQGFIFERILEDPIVVSTWALAIATIVLVIVGICYGRSQSKKQVELIKQQRALVQEQKNTTEEQKLTMESIQKSAKLHEKSLIIGQMIKIDQMLNDETALSERNIVYKHISGQELHGNFHVIAERVSDRFDRIGAIIAIHDDLRAAYLQLHARETGKSWISLYDYVIAERRRKHDQLYYRFFASIGQESVQYWNSRNPNDPLGLADYKRENSTNMYAP
jgi:hypothetical protein